MKKPLRIAVIGAGLVGRRHVELASLNPDSDLCAVVDPAPSALELATKFGAPWFGSIDDMLTADLPDAAIVATPNATHLEVAGALIAAGVPTLVEKPIADTVEAAERLDATARAANVPLLIGQHRRHSGSIAAARAVVGSGRLGRLAAVNAMCWLLKPDDYFDVDWRSRPGGGPVLINLIHVIDDIRTIAGVEIVAIQATESRAARGFDVEDAAAVVLEFANGAVGTINLTDGAAAPWSWELTAGENLAYPRTDQSCYLFGGREASLSVPDMALWRHEKASWWSPIHRETIPIEERDPLAAQLDHFIAVARREVEPLVPGREAIATLRATLAIKEAARTGCRVTLFGRTPEGLATP